MVSFAEGVPVPTESKSELVVKVTVVPLSVTPLPVPPPTQLPLTEKQPAVRFTPPDKVLVAVDDERIDPPVKVMPPPDDRPPAEMPEVKVDVAPEVFMIEPPVMEMPLEEKRPEVVTPPIKLEVAEVAVDSNVPEVLILLVESMVMSLGTESSVTPDIVPEMVGALRVIFGGREVMRLVLDTIFCKPLLVISCCFLKASRAASNREISDDDSCGVCGTICVTGICRSIKCFSMITTSFGFSSFAVIIGNCGVNLETPAFGSCGFRGALTGLFLKKKE